MKRRFLVWGAVVAGAALLSATALAAGRTHHSTFTLTTLANAAPAGSPDPQVNYTLQEWSLLILSHDGLVGFQRAAGAAGTQIVPDLATTVPKPTNGGLTYTFTLRSGIKFSNGKLLTPNDVRATFERLFKIGNSPNAGTWYDVIDGAAACIKKPKTCSLAKGITISGNKITFHLTKGDPEFLDQLAVPFAFILPASTPAKDLNIPPAGTGPYMWAEYSPNEGDEARPQPVLQGVVERRAARGHPDVIVQKFGLTVEAEVTAVENNQADWIASSDVIPADRLNELSTKYAKQVYVFAADGDVVLRVQHAHPAVQQPEGAAGR